MEQAYPVLRINDYEEAKRYYLDFLGFSIDFEWRHAEGLPVYMGPRVGMFCTLDGHGVRIVEILSDESSGEIQEIHLERMEE